MASFANDKKSILIPYNPPVWAKELKFIPKFRVQLAQPNTPIHKWNIPGAPPSYSVFIKRDDMTGSTLTGNKVRKLEFLLADALDRGCSHVITVGGIQSNLCRAVAIAARQLRLTPHLLLGSDISDVRDTGCSGNVLAERMCGALLYIVPSAVSCSWDPKPDHEKLARTIKCEKGEDSYLIPLGGSNCVGLFGYISMFQELISQGVMEMVDDLVFACGTGGSAAGLGIANYLTGSKLRCHGIIVGDVPVQLILSHIQEMLDIFGLQTEVKSEDIIDFIMEYRGKGYGISRQEELEYIVDVSMTTGIFLDPIYTGKAAFGLVQELQANPDRFKGKRILFVHTGGLFGLYEGKMEAVLTKPNAPTDRVKMWKDENEAPS